MSELNNKTNNDLIISYLTLRKSIGYIGIMLPIVLAIGMLLLSDSFPVQDSISDYYHSKMRDLFVGSLCAVSLFLFSYTGYPGSNDNIFANLAAISALGVVFFPVHVHDVVHYTSAAVFFLLLAYFSFFIFTKCGQNKTEQKEVRDKVYKTCGVIIILCLLLIGINSIAQLEENGHNLNQVFWLETLALWAFGVSWLTKGETLFADNS